MAETATIIYSFRLFLTFTGGETAFDACGKFAKNISRCYLLLEKNVL